MRRTITETSLFGKSYGLFLLIFKLLPWYDENNLVFV